MGQGRAAGEKMGTTVTKQLLEKASILPVKTDQLSAKSVLV